MFDLSNPKEYSSFTEYNSLHDPHLKSYFYHADMKRKLIDKGFITRDLNVICSLKEYNAYRNFLEMESMKLHRKENEEKERERRVCEAYICRQILFPVPKIWGYHYDKLNVCSDS